MAAAATALAVCGVLGALPSTATAASVSPNAKPMALSNSMSAVSCTSADFCVAVGVVFDGASNQPLVELWDGRKWKVVKSPDAGSGGVLKSVSCVSNRWCIAVGSYYPQGSSYAQTLVMVTSNGGHTWRIVPSPNTSTSDSDYLNSVSCTSDSYCAAVGAVNPVYGPPYGDLESGSALIETWDGTSWTQQSLLGTSLLGSYALNGVSCTSGGDCTAVGAAEPFYPEDEGLIVTGSGNSWTVSGYDYRFKRITRLYGVSCPSSGDCTAVGTAFDKLYNPSWQPWFVTASNDGAAAVSPAFNNYNLYGISCISSNSCTAVGTSWYVDPLGVVSTYYQPLVETWDGTSWTIVPSASASGTDPAYLNSVSCTSSIFCMATGSVGFESWDGTSWTIVPSPPVYS
jgi:hypothetical protein